MSSYLETIRKQLEECVSLPVRFTKDPAFGMFAVMVSGPVGTSFDDLPFVERAEFVPPVFLNFYLADGWQQAAVRQILSKGPDCLSAPWFDDFEIQYAYNRICNQLELLASLGYSADATQLELLTAPVELVLMELLAKEPNLYLIAKGFHAFFDTCPIRGEATDIAGARMALMQACRRVFELS